MNPFEAGKQHFAAGPRPAAERGDHYAGVLDEAHEARMLSPLLSVNVLEETDLLSGAGRMRSSSPTCLGLANAL